MPEAEVTFVGHDAQYRTVEVYCRVSADGQPLAIYIGRDDLGRTDLAELTRWDAGTNPLFLQAADVSAVFPRLRQDWNLSADDELALRADQ